MAGAYYTAKEYDPSLAVYAEPLAQPDKPPKIKEWRYLVVRDYDGYPLVTCETLAAARYIEMLLNDRPLGWSRLF